MPGAIISPRSYGSLNLWVTKFLDDDFEHICECNTDLTSGTLGNGRLSRGRMGARRPVRMILFMVRTQAWIALLQQTYGNFGRFIPICFWSPLKHGFES